MSWFGLVSVCFVVFCISEVLGEAGRGFVLAGVFASSHNCSAFGSNRPHYLYPGLLSECCQIVIFSSCWHMFHLVFSRLPSVSRSFCPQSSFACFSPISTCPGPAPQSNGAQPPSTSATLWIALRPPWVSLHLLPESELFTFTCLLFIGSINYPWIHSLSGVHFWANF